MQHKLLDSAANHVALFLFTDELGPVAPLLSDRGPREVKVAHDSGRFFSAYGEFETHDACVARLRSKHSRKSGFWRLVADPAGGQAKTPGFT